ncbi:MAG: thermonuclease family protein [Nanoarchaeota archaeon]
MILARCVLAAAMLFLVAASAHAETLEGPIPARVIRVIDGDTLEVEVRIWFGQDVTVNVRVLGVDTPEMKGKCPAEIAAARNAGMFTLKLAPPGGLVQLHDVKLDKFAGRVDAIVELVDKRDLSAALIAAGHARPYAGGKRQSWCP